MKFCNLYKTDIGEIVLVQENGALCNVIFGNTLPQNAIRTEDDQLLNRAYIELEEYFSRKRRAFDLPVYYNGTAFQNRVWGELCNIKYGEVLAYKQLAQKIGNPNACRAVGNANNKNPLPIIIPCHRVVGTNGNLIGYAGGLEAKKKLLKLEGLDY